MTTRLTAKEAAKTAELIRKQQESEARKKARAGQKQIEGAARIGLSQHLKKVRRAIKEAVSIGERGISYNVEHFDSHVYENDYVLRVASARAKLLARELEKDGFEAKFDISRGSHKMLNMFDECEVDCWTNVFLYIDWKS